MIRNEGRMKDKEATKTQQKNQARPSLAIRIVQKDRRSSEKLGESSSTVRFVVESQTFRGGSHALVVLCLLPVSTQKQVCRVWNKSIILQFVSVLFFPGPVLQWLSCCYVQRKMFEQLCSIASVDSCMVPALQSYIQWRNRQLGVRDV